MSQALRPPCVTNNELTLHPCAALQRWSLEKGIAGLDGLAFSLLVSVIWSVTIVFLLVDLVTVLLLPSRDLQEGTVIPLGASPPPFFFVCASTAYPALPLLQIISIMQVPLVILYLKWELSAANSVWVQRACEPSQALARGQIH